MKTIRYGSWLISMETRRKLDDEEKKGISKCDDCDFCSPVFN